MKTHTFLNRIFILLFLIPVICSAQKQKVVIRIIQDQSIPLSNFETSITLKKKSFKFQLLLDHVEGVHVFASIKDSIYRFTETSPIYDFPYLKLLELRDDDLLNTNKELNISETGWSYWYYNDTSQIHSFSRKIVNFSDKQNVCTKVIKQLFDIGDGKVIKLSTLESPLYLFFVVVKEYDENGKPISELMRRKVKVNWEPEDD